MPRFEHGTGGLDLDSTFRYILNCVTEYSRKAVTLTSHLNSPASVTLLIRYVTSHWLALPQSGMSPEPYGESCTVCWRDGYGLVKFV